MNNCGLLLCCCCYTAGKDADVGSLRATRRAALALAALPTLLGVVGQVTLFATVRAAHSWGLVTALTAQGVLFAIASLITAKSTGERCSAM
jgi:hypothetical protein